MENSRGGAAGPRRPHTSTSQQITETNARSGCSRTEPAGDRSGGGSPPSTSVGVVGLIKTTRLDGSTFYVSPHQIEIIEETPDTVIRLVSGKKILVREDVDEVIERIIQYRRKIAQQPDTKDLPLEQEES